jgi:diguanylate cyclase (GGDEF)-like protein
MQTEITLRGLQPYLSFLGTFVQLGGTLLLIALFGLLRRYAVRRRYFRTWATAWLALAVALMAVVLRYNLLPSVIAPEQLIDSAWQAKLIFFVYQTAKFLFYALLVAGTMMYVRAAPRYTTVVATVAFSLVYAAIAAVEAADLNEVVAWQAPVAVAALAYCSFRMFRLPPSRRSLGSTTSAAFFAFGAALWAMYFTAFTRTVDIVVNYNTYLDLVWHISLGFGMVVLLMEDMKHDSDAAHAELAVAHDNLRRASFYDSVTGSLNRQAFADGLGLEGAAARYGAAVMLDMDDLKRVNDDLGHASGDAALRYLVDVLRATLRPTDKMYRWGGDEFLLICPGADPALVVRRLRRLLANAPPLVLGDGREFALRVSLGGAYYGSGEELNAAIDAADRAMYAHKVMRKKAGAGEIAQSA